MRLGRGRGLAVAAALALAVGVTVGGHAPAWADAAPAPSATPVPAPTPAPTAGTVPRGCAGITPTKPWRLVASRAMASSTDVRVEWSVVGCATGYRVHVAGTGVDRTVAVTGGATASVTVPDLVPTLAYRITVTTVGAGGDGGVSGTFVLRRSAAAADADLTVDFPDPGPAGPVAPTAGGDGPWSNPVLSWVAPAGPAPRAYRVTVTGPGGAAVVERTVPGSASSARLGEEVVAGEAYRATVTPILADGIDGTAWHLAFGSLGAPSPERVTGIAPVVQFSPVAGVEDGRVLGYEVAYGPLRAGTHVFVDASALDPSSPWVVLDPTADAAAAPRSLVAVVRTITTMGHSAWTPAATLGPVEVATAQAAYYAGIGHVADGDTVPRQGFLNVHGAAADIQVTDLVWSASRPAGRVTVAVYGPGGASTPAFTQEVPLTRTADGGRPLWRLADIPLPDGWSSVVLRRGGADVARWSPSAGRACVSGVAFADAPTDLPALWQDSWCP